MKPKRVKKGDVVRIEFLDHIENDDEPLTLEVFGRVRLITDNAITVAGWQPVCPDDACSNSETIWTIVRGAILFVTIYSRRNLLET